MPEFVLEGEISFDPISLEVQPAASLPSSAAGALVPAVSTASLLGSLLRLPHPFVAEREIVLGKVSSLLHKLVWYAQFPHFFDHLTFSCVVVPSLFVLSWCC